MLEFREMITLLHVIEFLGRIDLQLMSSQKVSSSEWGTCMHGLVQITDEFTKRCQDYRTLIIELRCLLDLYKKV